MICSPFLSQSDSVVILCRVSAPPQLQKPTPQRERAQWEVGVGHAEDAFLMTRQERIDNYTFIYVDPDPNAPPPAKKPAARAERRTQRTPSSTSSTSKKEEGGAAVTSPDRDQTASTARRQQQIGRAHV